MRNEYPRVITRRSLAKSAAIVIGGAIAAHAPLLAKSLQAPSRGLWDAMGWDDAVALDWGDEIVALAQDTIPPDPGETQGVLIDDGTSETDCGGTVCAEGKLTSKKCRNRGDCGERCCINCKLLVCKPTSNTLDPLTRHNIYVYRNDGFVPHASCNGGGVGRDWTFIKKKDQQTDDWQSVCDLRDETLPPSVCCCTHIC